MAQTNNQRNHVIKRPLKLPPSGGTFCPRAKWGGLKRLNTKPLINNTNIAHPLLMLHINHGSNSNNTHQTKSDEISKFTTQLKHVPKIHTIHAGNKSQGNKYSCHQ